MREKFSHIFPVGRASENLLSSSSPESCEVGEPWLESSVSGLDLKIVYIRLLKIFFYLVDSFC